MYTDIMLDLDDCLLHSLIKECPRGLKCNTTYLSASSRERAPEIISFSSVVTLAWRVRLNVRVNLSIISAEFLVEFSIACTAQGTQALDSLRNRSALLCMYHIYLTEQSQPHIADGQIFNNTLQMVLFASRTPAVPGKRWSRNLAGASCGTMGIVYTNNLGTMGIMR
jgi:hypothetical protein